MTPKRPLDGTHLGQRVERHAEQVAQLVGPLPARGCRTASCGWRSTGRWRARSPPVRFQSSHESIGAERQVGVDGDAALGEQPLELRCREVRVEHEARCARGRGEVTGRRRSSSQRAAVRRSCQTIARCRGSPVRRSQATTVSRWLVMPMAATGAAPTRPTTSASVAATAVPDLVGVVLDPARLREVLGELAVRRRRRGGRRRTRRGCARRWCRRRWRSRTPRHRHRRRRGQRRLLGRRSVAATARCWCARVGAGFDGAPSAPPCRSPRGGAGRCRRRSRALARATCRW